MSLTTNNPYQRNLIKERWQDEILAFVYNSAKYNQLIFTGGTCLRKAYGLNRLSEDLDFDFTSALDFSIQTFAVDISKNLNVLTKVANNQHTVFVQLPDDIFVRCDFSAVASDVYQLDRRLIMADNRQFFVLAYDLPTLFTNKIVAFLRRNFFKGKFQKVPFKGRDIYDLYWLLQLSAKTGYQLQPNLARLTALLGVASLEEIRRLVQEKIMLVDAQFVRDDLQPLVESAEFLDQFLASFATSIEQQVTLVLG
jgi:predicted nucleotidyltransferase component of viral defense system